MDRELRKISVEQHVPAIIAYAFSAVVAPIGAFFAAQSAWILLEGRSYSLGVIWIGAAVAGLLLGVGCFLRSRNAWRSFRAEKFEALRRLERTDDR